MAISDIVVPATEAETEWVRGTPCACGALRGDDLEIPRLSPDVAVEALSPDDRRIDVESKIATHLAAGSEPVVIVDPQRQVVELNDGAGRNVVRRGHDLIHPALPGLCPSVSELFDTIAPR